MPIAWPARAPTSAPILVQPDQQRQKSTGGTEDASTVTEQKKMKFRLMLAAFRMTEMTPYTKAGKGCSA